MAKIPFPNEKIDLGTQEPFIRDLQNALNIAETGVYDFLTMCHVIVHKFRHGLNHHDPTVDQETWTSVMDQVKTPEPAPAPEPGGGNNAAAPTPGVATIGQINRDPDPAAPDENYRATTTGTTNATDENIPPIAQQIGR